MKTRAKKTLREIQEELINQLNIINILILRLNCASY